MKKKKVTNGILEWHNEKRVPSSLVPMSYNPRKLTDKQRKDLESSLKKFNLVEIPAINTDGQIIAGHQRVAVLLSLGRDESIDVRVPNRKLTKEEVDEYNIRSNKNTGEWDMDLLVLNFDPVKLLDWGFDRKELDDAKDLCRTKEQGSPDVEFTEELLESRNYIVLYFTNEIDWLHLQSIFPLSTVKSLDSREGFNKMGIGRVVNGVKFLEKIMGFK